MRNNTSALHLPPRNLKSHSLYTRRRRRNHGLIFPRRPGSGIISEYLRPICTHSPDKFHPRCPCPNARFLFTSSSNIPDPTPPLEEKDAIAAAKNPTTLSNVAVVRSRSQGSVERYLISGAMRRRRHAQKGVVQWCVERRMEGRVWKMDCWVCIDGDVVDVGDVGGGGGVA